MSDDLDVARGLIEAGIPVCAARRAVKDGEWDPTGGNGRCGYWLPPKWQLTIADEGWLGDTGSAHMRRYGYRPGDALGAVMGHQLDLVDLDTQNWDGWDGLQATLPTPIAAAGTPSGGLHVFVAPLGVQSRDDVAPGVDVKAGLPDGKGRGFAWIAPTVKLSKTTGELRAYVWTKLPPAELPTGPDGSGEALVALIGSTRRKPSAEDYTAAEGDTEAGERALVGLVRVVKAAGERKRNATLNWAAYRAGEHVAAGRLDAKFARECLSLAAADIGLDAVDTERHSSEATRTITSGPAV
jgi:hypothetical protein